MPRISVDQLYKDNAEALKLTWLSGNHGGGAFLDSGEINHASQGLIGHLNLIHPNWIQIFSRTEAAYYATLSETAQREALSRLTGSGLTCIILSDQEQAPATLAEFAAAGNIPLIASPQHSLQIIWVIRTYLGRALAESITRHGVFLDVLGMGVLITGESGVGKSELALELISRGSGLVADDVVELYHIAPQTLEGRSPELIKDFLEVRGLGMLNIRTIFGETAIRIRKNLKLIVQLQKPVGGVSPGLERLPLNASTEEVMGINIRKVILPVAAGRNLAVLTEAAVRNYVLQLRGMDSTQEFVQRQEQHMGKPE
ncbi:MAG: HPr(Ser) kinase/phosphatase [Burkholderiales bacterium]